MSKNGRIFPWIIVLPLATEILHFIITSFSCSCVSFRSSLLSTAGQSPPTVSLILSAWPHPSFQLTVSQSPAQNTKIIQQMVLKKKSVCVCVHACVNMCTCPLSCHERTPAFPHWFWGRVLLGFDATYIRLTGVQPSRWVSSLPPIAIGMLELSTWLFSWAWDWTQVIRFTEQALLPITSSSQPGFFLSQFYVYGCFT